jgi:hypothetical protein
VRDEVAGLTGAVAGMLMIAPCGEGLDWLESGEFLWTDATGALRRANVRRRTLLLPAEGTWWMHFEDGRRFHPWQPGRRVEHPCGEDAYTGLVDVGVDGRTMRTVWDVTGPAKRQRLITRLYRT